MHPAAALALAAGVAVAAAEDAQERAALDKAAASIKWLNDYSCPSIGLPPNVKGMQTDAETGAQRESSWAFAQSRVEALRGPLAQREAVLGQAKKSDNYDAELERLDATLRSTMARTGTALVNWALANWVEIARVDPAHAAPPQGPHPLERYARREARLRELGRAVERLPGAAEYVQPVVDKFHRCLVLAQNQVVERNADSLRVAMKAATRSDDLPAITRPYGLVDPTFGGDAGVAPPAVIDALTAHAATLKERERATAEAEVRRLTEVARAEEARRGNARPSTARTAAAADPPVDQQARLKTASALVNALTNRSVADALRYMHDDVSLSSPLGHAQGKSQVSSALQQGFSSGRAGRIGEPYVSAGQVIAGVQSPRGSATMVFVFKDNLVSGLSIR